MMRFKVWLQLTKCAFASYATHWLDAGCFLLSKVVRFGFLGLMIISLFHFTTTFAGYTRDEALLFYLTYNFIDVLTQALFRGIYLFARDVNRGNFDFALIKPVSPLLYSLLRETDILDILFLIPITVLLVLDVSRLAIIHGLVRLSEFTGFVVLGLIISLSLHILSAGLTLITLESDHIIWFYRRTLMIGSFPPEILPTAWQLFFTYAIPILIITAFPAKALLGRLAPFSALAAVGIAVIFLTGSLLVWRVSIRRYSSASS